MGNKEKNRLLLLNSKPSYIQISNAVKKTITILTFCLMAIVAHTQNINGRIIDENVQPLPFANVVLLSLPDSTFVQGAVSDINGQFSIKAKQAQGLLKVSSIGYLLYVGKSFRQLSPVHNL